MIAISTQLLIVLVTGLLSCVIILISVLSRKVKPVPSLKVKQVDRYSEKEEDVIDVVIPWAGEPNDQHKYTGAQRDDGIIKYTIRSICKNMPWVRNIIVFMDPPTSDVSFIRNENKKIKSKVIIVDRCKYFIDSEKNCPSTNFYAIYLSVHRVPFLAEKWIEIDDDIVVLKPMFPENFFAGDSINADVDTGSIRSLYGNKKTVRVPKSGGVPEAYDVELPSAVPSIIDGSSCGHYPFPNLTSLWRSMYDEYTDWFKFVSSHKKRFCFDDSHVYDENDPLDGGCYKECTIGAYRWYAYKNNRLQHKGCSSNELSYDELSSDVASVIRGCNADILNINDSAVWHARDCKLLEDAEQYAKYSQRVEKLHRALEELFPRDG